MGCSHNAGLTDLCDLHISMVSLEGQNCKANIGVPNEIVDQQLCTKKIPVKVADWFKNHSIIISAREDNYHHYSASYTIQLITVETYHHLIWSEYRLPDIRVRNYFSSIAV